ncbi:unnamed protein product, partial [Prorocentrum cordatum]
AGLARARRPRDRPGRRAAAPRRGPRRRPGAARRMPELPDPAAPAAVWAPPRSVFKIVVVGAPGVGKSSLVRLLLGAPAPPAGTGAAGRGAPRARDLAAGAGRHSSHDGGPEPTVGADFCTRAVFLDGSARPVRLPPAPLAQERFKSVVEPCITGLEDGDHDAVVVVYDTSASESLEEANALILQARRLAAGSPQVALVGCKCDRGPREVSTGEGRARAAELGAAVFVEASCPPPLVGDRQVDRLPGEALSTHAEAEEKLVRPLLRRCREAAGPAGAPLPPAPAAEPQCRAAARTQQHPRCSVLRCLGLA